MIVIGYNYDDVPISIVDALSKELAMAYWHGAGIIPHSTKTSEDFTPLGEHPTGVIPLLKTEEKSDYDLSSFGRNPRGRKIITVVNK